MPLLEVKNLTIGVRQKARSFDIVRDISFQVESGEICGIVGESGSGKSITALSLMRLNKPPLAATQGDVIFNGIDLMKLSERKMRAMRGKDISMIFQEPMTSLHPLMSIGEQIRETIRQHMRVTNREVREISLDILGKVGINSPAKRLSQLPHELSGGMRQRIMIAMALACDSKLLLADEPTTALDVTIQAQILELLQRLNKEKGLSVLLITHDIGIVSEICRKIIVLYAGEIMEAGDAFTILHAPMHPYTEALLRAIPKTNERKEILFSIPGKVPRPTEKTGGCVFAPRCHKKMSICTTEHPLLENVDGRKVRCLQYKQGLRA